MSELKPCPVCGGQPGRFLWKQNLDEDSYYISYECNKKDHSVRVSGDNDEEAAEAWNTRYEPICQWKVTGLDFEDTYATSCGEKMIWEPYGVPAHCPGCGARVEEVD